MLHDDEFKAPAKTKRRTRKRDEPIPDYSLHHKIHLRMVELYLLDNESKADPDTDEWHRCYEVARGEVLAAVAANQKRKSDQEHESHRNDKGPVDALKGA